MTIRFYLKRPGSTSCTSIYALVNYNSNSLKIYTGERIVPKYWNQENNCAKNTQKFPEHPEFNQRLINIRSAINRVFLDYRNNNDHEIPSPAILKQLIESALRFGIVKVSFLDYFEDFVKRTFAGKRTYNKNGETKVIGTGVAKGYQTTLTHLINFNKISRRKVDFDTIDLDFHHDFTDYLTAKPLLLSANTIGSNFQRIKAVMSEATEKGVNKNMAFKSKNFIKQKQDVSNIYLNESELKEMKSLPLQENSLFDNVRDLFLIGCYTGLRISDFSMLKQSNIADGFIRITQKKTGSPVVIPVHAVVKSILNKRNGELPKEVNDVVFNRYLKQIGEKMPSLQELETKSIKKGGVNVTITQPKWKLLSSHTARRSFCTNEYLAGTPPITIMAITGHKTETLFLSYIKVTLDEHAHKMKELWDKRGKKTGLKVA